MAEHKTLLEFLMDLLNNHDALADFRDDPHAALQAAGLGNVCVDDIKELLPVVLEKVDAEKCAQYEDDCDDDKCWDAEPKHHDGEHHHHRPIDCDDEGRPAPHCSEIDKVVTHLNYVTNNYSYDSHDTIYNTTNVTKIWAGDGSEVNVNNETNNIGSHGVQVQGDSNAPIVTGDNSFVGDGNQVASGHDSATSFGAGSAYNTGDIDAGDHGGINFGAGTNTVTDASTSDSGNIDNSHQDNHTEANVDSSNSGNTDNSHQDNHTEANTDSSDSGNGSGNVTSNEEHNALLDASHATVSPVLDLLDHAGV